MPVKGHLTIMLQNFFFPSGYLILVDFGDRYSFLHSLMSDGYPHCCFPGFGAFSCFSDFSDAEKVANHVCSLDGLMAFVVKIRPVKDIRIDVDSNRLVLALSSLDNYKTKWYPLGDSRLFSDELFFVNRITYVSNE